jgi:hypothetical protein
MNFTNISDFIQPENGTAEIHLGGIAYFYKYISYYLPYVIWCIFEILLGIGGLCFFSIKLINQLANTIQFKLNLKETF